MRYVVLVFLQRLYIFQICNQAINAGFSVMALKQYEQHISMTDFKQQWKLNFLVRQVKIYKVAICKNKIFCTVVRPLSEHDHFSKPLLITQFCPDNENSLPLITRHSWIIKHKVFNLSNNTFHFSVHFII